MALRPPPPYPGWESLRASRACHTAYSAIFSGIFPRKRDESGQNHGNLPGNLFLFPSPASWRGSGRPKNDRLGQGRDWGRGAPSPRPDCKRAISSGQAGIPASLPARWLTGILSWLLPTSFEQWTHSVTDYL